VFAEKTFAVGSFEAIFSEKTFVVGNFENEGQKFRPIPKRIEFSFIRMLVSNMQYAKKILLCIESIHITF